MSATVGVYFGYRHVAGHLVLNDGIEVNPGPPTYEGVADTVNRAVVITVGGGPGLFLEEVFDRVLVSIDTAGDQSDPRSAEDLAMLVDQQMLALDRPRDVAADDDPGDKIRVLAVTRAGGRPTPVAVDDGDRTHLACSYIWQVQSGV